jgi:hypothetical protein
VEDLKVHHHPSPVRDRRVRRRLMIRNYVWFVWLRRPSATAVRCMIAVLGTLSGDADARAGLLEAVLGLPGVLRRRRVVPPDVETK